MIIANHSFPQATIIIPDDASSVNRFAADELNKYLRSQFLDLRRVGYRPV